MDLNFKISNKGTVLFYYKIKKFIKKITVLSKITTKSILKVPSYPKMNIFSGYIQFSPIIYKDICTYIIFITISLHF